jgi:hypothetical protein
VLTTRDWVRAVEHVVQGEIPEGTYELASFNAWMRVHREGRGDQVIHVRPDTGAAV